MYTFNIKGIPFVLSPNQIVKSDYLNSIATTQIPTKKNDKGEFLIDEDPTFFFYLTYLLQTDTIDDRIYHIYSDKFMFYGVNTKLYPDTFKAIRYNESVKRNDYLNSKIDLIPLETLKTKSIEKVERDFDINKQDLLFHPQLTAYRKQNNGIIDATNMDKKFDDYFKTDYPNNLLNTLDYSNICIAGGSILAAIIGTKINDIDLFLTIPRSLPEEERIKIANEKIVYIINHINTHKPEDCKLLISRSKHVISIVIIDEIYETTSAVGKGFIIGSENESFEIQIILRLYDSISEVLLGFDIDCCCLAWNGKEVLASARAIHALKYGVNMVDQMRRSPTYEERLFKYAQRGFAIYVPLFKREYLDYKTYMLLTIAKNDKLITDAPKEGLAYLLRREIAKYYSRYTDIMYKIQREHNSNPQSKTYPLISKDETAYICDYGLSFKHNDKTIQSFTYNNMKYHVSYVPNHQWLITQQINNETDIEDLIKHKPQSPHQVVIKFRTFTVTKDEFYEIIFNADDLTFPITDIKTFYIPEELKPIISFDTKITYMLDNPGKQLSSSFQKLVNEDISKWYTCVKIPSYKLNLTYLDI